MKQPEPYRPGEWRIPISRPQLPPLEDYQALLGRIWESHLLSNFSEQAMTLQDGAAAYIGNPNTRVVSSCDIGLALTIAAQRIPYGKKALIPSFTFSSTVNAAIWNGLEPVFVDLNPWDFCVDPQAILRKLRPDVGLIIENRSRNTAENAEFSKEMANPQPGQNWLLVTSAFHMPRSMGLFRKAGFPVIAWPSDYRTSGREGIGLFRDNPADSLQTTTLAIREWAGLLGYWLSGRIDELVPSPD